MLKIRKPVVAGAFYPANPAQLKQTLMYYLKDAPTDGEVSY